MYLLFSIACFICLIEIVSVFNTLYRAASVKIPAIYVIQLIINNLIIFFAAFIVTCIIAIGVK